MSFLAELLFPMMDIRLTVAIFCAIPAFLLTFIQGKIRESAIFAYKSNKVNAFNIINLIAKFNDVKPILVDLAKSVWVRHKDRKLGTFGLLGDQ